jgi:hypothetical protein
VTLKVRFLWTQYCNTYHLACTLEEIMMQGFCDTHSRGLFRVGPIPILRLKVKVSGQGHLLQPTLFLNQHLFIKFSRVRLEVYYWIQPRPPSFVINHFWGQLVASEQEEQPDLFPW